VAMKVNILMGGGWVCCYEREREKTTIIMGHEFGEDKVG